MVLKSLPIRIQQWLEENPQVWRYLGCTSAVVGLLCFALSSYLNILFRHWSLLKIVLYSVASAGICVALWFAKDLDSQEGSTTRRFHAYIKVFMLISGSIISGIINKVLNKKPDVYGLASCAAFAVMSFSLSRQTDYGFEAEMESFFMGTLLGQLWLIKWWFLSAGGGFWCLLTTLRSFLDDPLVDENVERQDRHFLAIQVDSEQSNASDALLSVPQQPNSSTDRILQEFKYTLRKLFRGQLYVSSELSLHLYRYLAKDDVHHIPSALVNDQNMLVDQLPSEAINDSHKKVGLMIAGGLENKCSEEYSIARRDNLKLFCNSLWPGTSLKRIWHSFLENDKDLVYQSHMIRSWIKFSNICMRVLFPYERRLCDRVFSGFSSVCDISFTKVCSEMTSNILNFAKVWADDRYSRPMNETVQVFETLHGLIPEFESLFSDEYSSALRNEATTIRNALGEAISDYYMKELESVDHMIRQICHDIEHESVLGGIHPITVKVMDRLHDIGKARDTLEIVFRYFPKVPIRDGVSLLSVDMAKIIELLQTHLEKRSKSFDSNALGYVFLMNNQRYAVQKVQGSRLGKILGDDWIQRQMKKVRRHLKDYQRSSWDEVLDLLKLEKEEESMAPGQAALSMLEKLELFNILFEEICRIQSQWFALVDLRMEVITGVENILLPAYGNFIGRFQNILGNRAYKYIKFGIHDIKAQLNHIFLGGKERDQ